jgi:3-phenylpropionate/trans-cinnamate dioxygenase ferredoxin reductase subunit
MLLLLSRQFYESREGVSIMPRQRHAIAAGAFSVDGAPMAETIVIAGAGHAAGQTVVSLRQLGFDGPIVVVGEEAYPPYQRPPLSKKFLAGELELPRLFLRPERFYAEHGVELRRSTRVEAIDRAGRQVRLDSGEILNYGRLVLATGSRVRRLQVPGQDLRGIHYLRTVDDVRGIQSGFRAGARLIVIGAGYIGMEVAAVAVKAGLRVTVLEVADRVMARVVAPPVSEFYAQEHRKAGVDLRLGVSPPVRFEGNEAVSAVACEDGGVLPADLAVVGIGVVPATELAEAAGLACDNGIIVDDHCRTDDPRILAIGDCTNHPNALLGRRLRLESVHNAQEQAKTAAAVICGKPEPYAQIPWFWSDQYDLKLQIVGLAGEQDCSILRGDPANRAFAIFHLLAGRLIAVEAINSPREFMLSKKLIAGGAHFDPATLADPTIDFKALAAAALA